jgi:uncharacterized membrane protein YvbJ
MFCLHFILSMQTKPTPLGLSLRNITLRIFLHFSHLLWLIIFIIFHFFYMVYFEGKQSTIEIIKNGIKNIFTPFLNKTKF